MIPDAWIYQAVERIAPHIQKTPLEYDPQLKIYLKWENRQITGSFKVRGALNKVLSLEEWERSRGLVAASAGNHGQGVALAGKLTGSPVTIFVPETAIPSKIAAIQKLGAQVIQVPGGYGEAEQVGLAFAQKEQATWISPYNDGQVIAGQGTIALEILEQAPHLLETTWIVPIGGGGLISGIGAVLAKHKPTDHLIGVQSAASPFFHTIFYTGSQTGVKEDPSLAEGLAGPVEEGSITIPIVKKLVEQILLVSESEIAHAIQYAWQKYGEQIEGSGAVSLAAILSDKIVQKPAVLIISGGNIQPEVFQRIIDGHYPR